MLFFIPIFFFISHTTYIKNFSYEKSFFSGKIAQEYLSGELAIALNIPKDTVNTYIENRLKCM